MVTSNIIWISLVATGLGLVLTQTPSAFDFGQLAIDNEIAMMIKKVRSGFGFSKESASLEEIKKAGPAGMFAANPTTLERMHTATFMPELADRKSREQWEDEGASTIQQRALNKALEILSTPNPAALDIETDARIHAEFGDLVAGDSITPEGWVPFGFGIEKIIRKKHVNRRRQKAVQAEG